jgi:hypothetical protein
MNPNGTPNATPAGETTTGGESQTTAPTTTTPAPVTTPDPKLDELQKQLDLANQRASQLANEKETRDRADAERRQKELEEQNQYKELFERSEQERKKLEQDREEETRKATLANAQVDILKDFSPEVQEIAATTGLGLTDDTQEAKDALKAKLDAIATKFPTAPAPHVQGNNRSPETPTGRSEEDAKLLTQMRFSDNALADQARRAVIGRIPQLDEMRKIAGVTPRE